MAAASSSDCYLSAPFLLFQPWNTLNYIVTITNTVPSIPRVEFSSHPLAPTCPTKASPVRVWLISPRVLGEADRRDVLWDARMTTRGPGTAESERVYVAQGRAATVCCQLDQVSTEQRFRWSLHIGTGQINNYLPPAKSVRSALVTMPCQEQQLQRGLTHIFSKPYSLRPAHLFPGKFT